ncbi:MAG: hypothetical protein K0S47_2578 [Herbinix sp.]|jgi:hypothetical protein|nr:hypothetical protein [Herbinix sp.]
MEKNRVHIKDAIGNSLVIDPRSNSNNRYNCQTLKILQVCNYHFSRWRKNKRIILSFFLAGIMSFLLTEKVMNFSMEQGTTIQLFEPFLWVFGDPTSILLSALITMLLFADLPLLDGAVPYYLIRIPVRVWILGQLLYIIIATFLYTSFILLTTIVFCYRNAFVGNIWSPTAALLGYSKLGEKIAVPAMLKTFEMSKPYECLLSVFFLLLLYVLVSVLCMFLASIRKGQLAGIISSFVFHMFGLLLNPDWIGVTFHLTGKMEYLANVICGWVSPLRQVTYHRHNFGYDLLPRLRDTYLIFGAVIFILIVFITYSMKRYQFNFLGTMEE